MLSAARYREIAAKFSRLRIAVVGDFCLDRYLEIDPGRCETSIETGLAGTQCGQGPLTAGRGGHDCE